MCYTWNDYTNTYLRVFISVLIYIRIKYTYYNFYKWTYLYVALRTNISVLICEFL